MSVVRALPPRWTDAALRIELLPLSNGRRARWHASFPTAPDLPRGRIAEGRTWLRPDNASPEKDRRVGQGPFHSHPRMPRDSVPLPWETAGYLESVKALRDAIGHGLSMVDVV